MANRKTGGAADGASCGTEAHGSRQTRTRTAARIAQEEADDVSRSPQGDFRCAKKTLGGTEDPNEEVALGRASHVDFDGLWTFDLEHLDLVADHAGADRQELRRVLLDPVRHLQRLD